MQTKMGFTECSEDNIKQKQQESEDLRANFEQTIIKLNSKKQEHEKQIQNLRQIEFEKQQKQKGIMYNREKDFMNAYLRENMLLCHKKLYDGKYNLDLLFDYAKGYIEESIPFMFSDKAEEMVNAETLEEIEKISKELKEIKMMENLLSSVEFEKEFKENVKEYL